MTQHNPPTDAELSEWAAVLAEVLAAHNATVGAVPDMDALMRKHVAMGKLEETAVRALPSLLTEVRRLRAAPVGYDAALRVAEAVRDEALTEVTHGEDCLARRGHECSAYQCERAGVAEMDLPAIVRATLGDDAVARAEREVLRLAVDSANREPWCLSDPPCKACDRCAWIAALDALTVAREEAGKR